MRANQHERLIRLVCPGCHLVIEGRGSRKPTVEALAAHYDAIHPELRLQNRLYPGWTKQ